MAPEQMKGSEMIEFLKRYTPTFCWVTMDDLFRMINQYFPGSYIDRESFRKTLHKLVKDGTIRAVPDNYPGYEGHSRKIYLRREQ